MAGQPTLLRIGFQNFYDSIIESFNFNEFILDEEEVFHNIIAHSEFDEDTQLYLRIMISSWNEFLGTLYYSRKSEGLLNHLNNHVNFLKRINIPERIYHKQIFKQICDRLFNFITANHIYIDYYDENDEPFFLYELNLGLISEKADLTDLVLYTLAANSREMNETTIHHIKMMLQELQKNDHSQVGLHLKELKAIQETCLTLLQMDGRKRSDSLVKKFHREFENINAFYNIFLNLLEDSRYRSFEKDHIEIGFSYQYLFLSILQSLRQWYQTDDEQYLIRAAELIHQIKTQNPFKPDDITMLNSVEILYRVSAVFWFVKTDRLHEMMRVFGEDLNDNRSPWWYKKIILRLIESWLENIRHLTKQVEDALNFAFLLMVETHTTIYKKKLFINLSAITKSMAMAQLISPFLVVRYLSDLRQIWEKLKKQPVKKIGRFIPVPFDIPGNRILRDFEKGLTTQYLFGLEDFLDWSESNIYYRKLLHPSGDAGPRSQITMNLFNMAKEIARYTPSDNPKYYSGQEDEVDLRTIKERILKVLAIKMINEYFYNIENPVLQVFYGTIISYAVNLAYYAQILTNENRIYILKELNRAYSDVSGSRSELPLFRYTTVELFNDAYEDEFNSVVNASRLYLPLLEL